jgi:hypothetical protein
VVKRLLLSASALVLVLTGSGAIAQAALRTTHVGVQTIAAHREHAAFREAERLMREFVPPSGAHAVRTPPGYGTVHVLRQSSGRLGEEAASIHRFWIVRRPLKTVAAFVRAHRLQGFGHFGALWFTGKPHYLSMGSSSPASLDSIPRRYFNVTVVALPRVTVLRVDARVVWLYPRAPSEKLPTGVRVIDVRVPKPNGTHVVRVTNSAKVARIAHWFDALPISPPGVDTPCFDVYMGRTTLSFRSEDGALLALATVPLTSAGTCDPIGFTIRSHVQRPLIDRPLRASFIERLQSLLGLQLVQTYR